MTLVLLFILGLCFGSFITALTYRQPKEISIAQGRSFCPRCKHQIAWYDNIPLFSYLFLGGKCRNCKKKISLRYPLIEVASGIGFVLIFVSTHNLVQIILNLAVFSILLSIFVTDVEHQIIPDDFVFFGILVVLLQLILNTSYQILYTNFLAAFLAASVLMLIHLLTKGRGMGLGDVKFAVFGGLIIGLKLLPVWLFLSFLTGGMVGIILILGKRARLKDKIAFGPFLIIGIALAIFFGDSILRFYGF